MNKDKNLNRLEWIDSAKGIGIILVVYGHVYRGLRNAGIFESETFNLIDSVIYTFHMPLFFVLSGLFYFSSTTNNSTKQIFLKKIDYIVYPYLIWSVVQILVKSLMSLHTNNEASLSDIGAILIEPKAQFWFLYVLFFSFLITFLFNSIFKEKGRYLNVLFAIILYFSSTNFDDGNILKLFSENYVFFTLGVCLYSLTSLNNTSFGFVFVLLASLSISQWFLHCYLGDDYTQKSLITLVCAVFGVFAVFAICLKLLNYTNYFSLIGSYSMEIYILHILCASGIRIVLDKFFSVENIFVHFSIGMIVGIFIPLLIGVTVRRLKITYIFNSGLAKS